MESSTLMSDWGLSEFLNEIFRGSRVHVAALAESTSDERQNAIRVLNEWDQIYRENLPDNVPPFCETTAVWGRSVSIGLVSISSFAIAAPRRSMPG